jgi:hypothetical protein
MGLSINHMPGRIDNNCAVAYFTFKVTGGTMCIVKSYTGHVVRPLAEFSGDNTNTIVVINIGAASIGFILCDSVAGYAASADKRSKGVMRLVAGATGVIKATGISGMVRIYRSVTIGASATGGRV